MVTLKKIVERKKQEKYAWPAGWHTREQAANDIGCTPREVDDTLREALADGDVQKQFFGVYDIRQRRVVRMPGYRVTPVTGAAAPEKTNVPKATVKGASQTVGRAGVKDARKPGTRLVSSRGLGGTMQPDGRTVKWDNGTATAPNDNTLRSLRRG